MSDFSKLLPAEIALRDAVCMGKQANINNKKPVQITFTNLVRAEFLRFLALGGDEDVPIHERGIRLQGAWIYDSLDLEGCNIPSCLILTKCHFDGRVIFKSTHIHGLVNLSGSQLPGLNGDRLVTEESLYICNDFVATESVRLDSAQISGNFNCDGGEFYTKSGAALSAELANVRGCVFLRNGFKASGTVNLMRSQIGGSLECDGGVFDGKGDNAITVEGARIQSSVYLRNGFKSSGTVRLIGAQIDGSLQCSNGEFDGQNDAALLANLVNVQGGVSLRNGFKASGTVNLMRSQIGGSLECDGGVFDGKGDNALTVEGARIQSSVYLRNGFKSSGTVRLIGTQIGGVLDCGNGEFDGKGDNALLAERANLEGNVFLWKEFKSNGTVSLINAKIGGDLICKDGQFKSAHTISVNANGMQLKGCFRFKKLKNPVNGISLVASRVGQLDDDEASWGTGLILDGFAYEHLSNNAPTSALLRLKWLSKQHPEHYGQDSRAPWWKQQIRAQHSISNTNQRQGFKPQPWKQLIHTLSKMGHNEDARQIAIYYETHRRKIGVVQGNLRRISHGLFGLLIGYGYRPLRLVYIMLGVWLFCGFIYWYAALHGVFAPSNPLIFNYPNYQLCRSSYLTADQDSDKENWYLCPQLAGEYTGFSPLAYSLDLILPLVDLQQDRDWAPYIPAPKENWLDELKSFSKYHWTRLLIWFEILFGWLSSLLLVAVISGLTNRDNDE